MELTEEGGAAGRAGMAELRRAMTVSRSLLLGVAVFSVFVNLLMLTGPLFMLQIYDRVLASGSEETLAALFGLVAALFLLMGLLDHARNRVLARVGARFLALLDRRVAQAALAVKGLGGVRDLDAIQRALASPAPFAFFDMPWTPVFIAVIFLFHWSLGVLAVAGGLLLLLLALINQRRARTPMAISQEAALTAESFGETLRREDETVQGIGMQDNVLQQWGQLREQALAAKIEASDVIGGYSVASKTLRLFLQSAILALGALLAIHGTITPGVMIAASILMGRALAPVDQGIAQWSVVQRARRAWAALEDLLQRAPPPARRTSLPRPAGHLTAAALVAVPPGAEHPTLRNVSFEVKPGQALGVIGPSASGKSTLARVLVGLWTLQEGSVRLDGAALDNYDIAERGRYIGYLPQDVALFDATVAQNIARLSRDIDPVAVVEAARRAGAHELILRLPDGYDTRVGPRGSRLSGGQRQRVALARALYGDPPVVVLDEPNSNLDSHGEQALIMAIRDLQARGSSVVVMAHRASAIAACETLLLLDQGEMRAYGPRDQVLRERVAQRATVVAASNGPRIVRQPEVAPR